MLGVRASLFPGGPCVKPVCSGVICKGNSGRSSGSGGGREGADERTARRTTEGCPDFFRVPPRCPDLGVYDVALIAPDMRDGGAQWAQSRERSHRTTRSTAPPPPPPLALFYC